MAMACPMRARRSTLRRPGLTLTRRSFIASEDPPGTRSISAIAWDGWSNSARAAISVHVNSGTVAVPNVVGLTQAAATSAITGAGLVVGTVTTAPAIDPRDRDQRESGCRNGGERGIGGEPGDCRRSREPRRIEIRELTPCRVADTRNPTGPFGGPIIAGGRQPRFRHAQ